MEHCGAPTIASCEPRCFRAAGQLGCGHCFLLPASSERWKVLRLVVEHEIHHRGEIYVYLGMLGVPTPPLYGMTSEQVMERSAKA
ncbi:MAG: DinB family protein [Acidobacteriia bacterium]|nr:DinB family protein [Terriglobia bacterium]